MHDTELPSDTNIFRKILKEIGNKTLDKTSVVETIDRERLKNQNRCFVNNLCNLLYFCTTLIVKIEENLKSLQTKV